MAIIYVDLLSGNDSTGTGTNLLPYLTVNKAVAMAINGDEIRIAKTAPAVVHAVSNTTWTNDSNNISTVLSHVGIINVGDYIGIPSAQGNGALETYYRVLGVTASAITIEGKYCGASATHASIKVIPLQVTGNAGVIAITVSKSLIISGGWTLATELQDSETWMRGNNTRTSSYSCLYVSTVGVSLSKLNIAESYSSFKVNFDNCNINSCTWAGSGIYGVELTGNNCSLTNCRGGSTISLSYASLQLTPVGGGAATFNNVIISGIFGVFFNSARTTISGLTIMCCTTGINVGVSSVIESFIISKCTTGATLSTNAACRNSTFTDCATGLNAATSFQGITVFGNNFSNCSVNAISFSQGYSALIENNIFTSNVYDVSVDQYSSNIKSINNSHNTPVTLSYNRPLLGGTIVISECTIDAPSLSKAFAVVSGESYQAPQFAIQNSFGKNGVYYAKYSVERDTSTVPFSVRMFAISTMTVNYSDFKVASSYAKQGVARNVSYYLKADNLTWLGTIIPKLKLNGKTIVTGASITSLTDGFVQYTISATGIQITSDGELSLEFNFNANTVGVNLKDFAVA